MGKRKRIDQNHFKTLVWNRKQLDNPGLTRSRIDEITERMATTEVVMPSVGLRPYSALRFVRRFSAGADSLCPLFFPLLSATSLTSPNLAARRCAWGHPTEEQQEERQRKGSCWQAPAFFAPSKLHGLHAPHMPTVTMHTFPHLGRPAAVDEDREGSDIGVHVGLPDAGRLEVHARVRGLGEILGLRPLVRVSVRIALGSEATSSKPRQRGESHRLARLVERLRLDRLSINGLKELDIAAHGSGGGGDQEHPDEHKGCAGRSECDPSQAGHSGNLGSRLNSGSVSQFGRVWRGEQGRSCSALRTEWDYHPGTGSARHTEAEG